MTLAWLDWTSNPEAWITLATLTLLEIVLGVDNIIVISILTGKLPKNRQKNARFVGLFLAMFMRIVLLLSISFLANMKDPWFFVGSHPVSGRDLVLLLGGLFLIYKSVKEIMEKFTQATEEHHHKVRESFASVIMQIIILDIVFSLDSVITAVGVANDIPVMVLAIVIAVIVMMFLSGPISDVVETYPSLKVLALAFLVLVGILLTFEGMHWEFLEKSAVYVAMGFSLITEIVNIRLRKAIRRGAKKEDTKVTN
jgi:predicted tellurium resistance membrane protein TerC